MCWELPDSLSKLAAWLIGEQGFVSTTVVVSKSFGNTSMVFESSRLNFRFVRDRGIWGIDVAANKAPSEYHDMPLLMALLAGAELARDITIDDEASFVQANWQEIERCFSKSEWNKTLATLKQLGIERAKRLFPGLYP